MIKHLVSINSSKDWIAFFLTAPALVSFVLYLLGEWADFLNASHDIRDPLGAFSVYAGMLGVAASIICLCGIRIRSNFILVCQILNGLWLAYIIYGLVSFGPFLPNPA